VLVYAVVYGAARATTDRFGASRAIVWLGADTDDIHRCRSNGEPLPEGHFMAVGNFGQFVYVAPDRDLVIVRLGDDWGTEDWPGLLAEIASRL
jgi:CubicO group peptidase (beta-lactamase class C family)